MDVKCDFRGAFVLLLKLVGLIAFDAVRKRQLGALPFLRNLCVPKYLVLLVIERQPCCRQLETRTIDNPFGEHVGSFYTIILSMK